MSTTELTVQPGSRVRRLLQLLWILQSNQGWSCSQIADHFQVSRRTIFRDIQVLRDSGIPVLNDGPTGGYKLTTTSIFRYPELEVLELFALSVQQSNPELAKIDLLQRAAKVAVAKLMAAVSNRVRTGVHTMTKRFSSAFGQGVGIAPDARQLDSALIAQLANSAN
jgi:predicted DNA-binding transcriptional regulator YafY